MRPRRRVVRPLCGSSENIEPETLRRSDIFLTPGNQPPAYPRSMSQKRRLQRHGNSLFLPFTPDVLLALGLKPGADGGEPEVEIELTRDGLLVKPLAAKPVAAELPPRWSAHPATRELLVAIRDHGPIPTGAVSEALGRIPQATSAALVRLQERGAAERAPGGWVITDTAMAWVAHLPSSNTEVPGGPWDNKRPYGSIPEVVLDALGDRQLTSSEASEYAGIDRSQAHHALKKLAQDGLVVNDGGRPVRWRRAT